MMLPILISVSDAPVSYFFWASAPPEVSAMTAVASAAIRNCCITCKMSSLGLTDFAQQLLSHHRHLPRAVRHEEDDEEQQDAEHRAGQALGDALGDVRNEDDEGGADEGAGQPADAADHHAEEQRDGEDDGVAVGRDELHRSEERRVGKEGRYRWSA